MEHYYLRLYAHRYLLKFYKFLMITFLKEKYLEKMSSQRLIGLLYVWWYWSYYQQNNQKSFQKAHRLEHHYQNVRNSLNYNSRQLDLGRIFFLKKLTTEGLTHSLFPCKNYSCQDSYFQLSWIHLYLERYKNSNVKTGDDISIII